MMIIRSAPRPLAAMFATFATGFCCLALFITLWFVEQGRISIFEEIDSKITDIFFRLRGEIKTSGSVIIVDIDEKSLQEVGQWPWPRDIIAELVNKIALTDPKALGFAMIFAEKDRLSPDIFLTKYRHQLAELGLNLNNKNALRTIFPNHDKLLGTAISEFIERTNNDNSSKRDVVQGYNFIFREDFYRNKTPAIPKQSAILHLHCDKKDSDQICSPSFLQAYRAVVNLPEITAGTSEGFLNTIADTDGAVRWAPTFIALNEIDNIDKSFKQAEPSYFPSFALEMVRAGEKKQEIHITMQNTNGHKKGETTEGNNAKKLHKNKHNVTHITTLGRDYSTDAWGRLGINFYGPYNTFLYISACDVLTDNAFLPQASRIIIGSSAAGIGGSVPTPFSPHLPEVELQATIIDNLLQNSTLQIDQQFNFKLNAFIIAASAILLTLSLAYLNIIPALLITSTGLAAIFYGSYNLFLTAQRPFALSYGIFAYILTSIAIMLISYVGEGRRRYLVRQAFSHYVAPSVVQELLKNPNSVNLHADSREVSIMFCDIRNFSSIAEELPPETLSTMLNGYFTLLTEIILKHKGTVDKYIGDAIMAVWGTPLHDNNHALHAVEAALEMLDALKDNPTLFEQNIKIGIGINSGMVSAGNFGSEKRFDYTVFGDNVNIAARVEQETKKYEASLLITEHTKKRLPPDFPCVYVDTVQVRGRNGETQLFTPK